MKIFHRVEGTLVLWKHPRTEQWEIVTNFVTEEAARKAVEVFNAYLYKGW
jgi:hypothetical protein